MSTVAAPTRDICDWACSTQYADLPAEVRKETITLLYDQVACMIAAATLPTCQPVVNLIQKIAVGGDCSIVGHPVRTSVTHAVLANGTIGHGDEVDSTGQQGTGHFAAVIIPTALSVGQHVGASGKELCRAIALGAEIAGRFVSLFGRYEKSFRSTASVGHTMGAAITAGTLLGLDPDRMEHALALTAGGACGLASHHEDDTHQIKSLELGQAALAGTLGALLALEGYKGPKEPLAVENGYFDAFLGISHAGDEVIRGLGEHYLMREVAYKRYPVGGPVQTPLYAFLQLIKTHQLSADDIQHVEFLLARNAFHTVTTNKNPAVYLEGILALAAVYGEITFAHINEPTYRSDPRVRAFRERARILIIPRSGPATRGQRLETTMTVQLRDGRVIKEQLRYPTMTEAEIHSKFHALAGLRLNRDGTAALEKTIKSIEQESNVRAFVRGLEIAY